MQQQQQQQIKQHQQQKRDGVVISSVNNHANIIVKNKNTIRNRGSGGSRTSSESSSSDVTNNGGSPVGSPSEGNMSSPASSDVTLLRATPSVMSTMDSKTHYSGVTPTVGVVSASLAVNSWHPPRLCQASQNADTAFHFRHHGLGTMQ